MVLLETIHLIPDRSWRKLARSTSLAAKTKENIMNYLQIPVLRLKLIVWCKLQ